MVTLCTIRVRALFLEFFFAGRREIIFIFTQCKRLYLILKPDTRVVYVRCTFTIIIITTILSPYTDRGNPSDIYRITQNRGKHS